MTGLADLDDVDLTTVTFDDGTPLQLAWRAGDEGGGLWVAHDHLPASAIVVDLDPMANRMDPTGFYPSSLSVQDLVTSWLHDGFNTYRLVTEEDPGGVTQARAFLLTDYRRLLGPTEVGANGSVDGLSYGRPGEPAGGFANLTTIVAEVRGSEDPANEIGGCIASLQLGRGGDPPPTASLWGSSYTLRGSVGRQPGGLMAYTAVVQNYYDGSGSRSDNYGYAAVTRPGIGDGADYHVHDPIRDSTTYPVDFGFIVCGDSGPCPEGGAIGYQVGFQAGGGVSPWSPREYWRSKIGTGLVVRDWIEGGVHVRSPHPDAASPVHLRLDRRDDQTDNLIECRSEDGLGLLAAVRPDGRVTAADGLDPNDLVTRSQLDAALAASSAELDAAVRDALERQLGAVRPDLAAVEVPALWHELVRRTSPLRPNVWRSVGRRARRRLAAAVRG
jgi:hypothetical protein